MTDFEDLLSSLNSEMTLGYAQRPIPIDLDLELTRRLGMIEAQQLPSLTATLSLQSARVIMAFAERSASWAVREKSPSRLELGLVAVAVAAAPAGGVSETAPKLALLWNAAAMIGEDPRLLFETTASRLGPLGGPLLSFAGRSADLQTVECMGYVSNRDRDGFRYERTW